MTITSSSSLSPSNVSIPGIKSESLSALKANPYRETVINENWNQKISAIFESRKQFFECLDRAHDDVLEMFKVEQVIQSKEQLNLLHSEYATLSDKEFVKCKSFQIKSDALKGVGCRLSLIQNERPELLINTKQYSDEIMFEKGVGPSLKDLRRIENEQSINWIIKKGNCLMLLSPEQKALVKDPEKVAQLLVQDSLEEKRKYIPKIKSSILNEKLQFLKCDLSKMPYEIIPKVDFWKLSDARVSSLMSGNIQHLDKLDMKKAKMQAIFRRLLDVTINTDEVIFVVDQVKRSVPYFNPYLWERVPDSVFVLIPFQELSKDELFRLFFPKSLENDNRLGFFAVESIPGCIRSMAATPTVLHASPLTDELGVIWQVVETQCDKNEYENLIQEKEKYNIRRLRLIGKEVYDAIKANLDSEIVKLGDSIYYPVEEPVVSIERRNSLSKMSSVTTTVYEDY